MESSEKQPQPQLPPGFRFHPTDEELVVHYLIPKAQSAPLPVSIIAELDLYKFDPWELPEKAVFGEQEWYFFSPRDRKYPNGARPNRAATSGYWKATGTDKPILRAGNHKVGVKKALVFYGGKPPKGVKTNWIMHEYRLADNNNNKPPHFDHSNNKKRSLRLDDWVLCRIYKKNNNASRPPDHEREDSMEEMMMMGSVAMSNNAINRDPNLSKPALNYIELGNDNNPGINCFQGMVGNQHGGTMKVDSTIGMVPTSGLYWGGASNSGKRVSLNDNDDFNNDNNNNNNSSDQLLHQQTMLGALSDGVMFRQPYQQLPGLNWYS